MQLAMSKSANKQSNSKKNLLNGSYDAETASGNPYLLEFSKGGAHPGQTTFYGNYPSQ